MSLPAMMAGLTITRHSMMRCGTILPTSSRESTSKPLMHIVIGSYMTRGEALDACVDYIMERIGYRSDLARSVAHDENHQGGYYIYDGTDTWHFDVDENDLFGMGSEVK